ncbi:glutathione S-transferase U10-like [Rhododendron vialii]|uniref:glutathione S-transferase U10-like n=1 Tax=Rhododendron vialii TaxID=182163 RepID=UPI00265D8427|nr:glutathione S-transferase U10-like [Rhododendron vialii]
MEGENIVKLHGTKNSAFSFRVELALKIKGIPYEYVDEDLRNKSETLLKYNPVHKKVPILVHNGKPVVESLVILEYIDEVWKENGHQLLPQDPCTRAKVRFWANFLHQQLFAPMLPVITTEGEAQAKAIKEEIDALKVVEEGMLEFFPTKPITSEDQLGLLDIVICSVLGYSKAIEEVIGVKLVDPERNPLVFSWVEALIELPAVKEIRPSHEKSVAFIHFIRDNLKAPKA